MSAERRADLAYFATLSICAIVLVLSGVLDHRTSQLQHSDFSYIWAGPRTILDGHDPYDPVQWRASVARLGTESFDDPAVYSYPPIVAIVLLPLAALPLPVAAGLWAGPGVLAAALSVRALLRAVVPAQPFLHGSAAGILLLSQPAVVTLYTGQSSFWLLAALSLLLLALRARRAPIAAIASIALLAKPQYVLVMLGGLAARAWRRGERRMLRSIVAVPAAVILLSAASSWAWWISWLSDVPLARSREPHITTLAALFADLGPAALPLTAATILLVLAVVLAGELRRADTTALWISAALLVAPYARSYDQLLLLASVVLISAVAGRAASAVVAAGAAILVPGTWVLFLVVGPYRGSETSSVIVPAAVFVLAAVVTLASKRRADLPYPP